MFVAVETRKSPPDLPLPAELSPSQLESELVDLAAQITAATCRWLELAAEIERRGIHETFGFADCARWLAWRCSLSQRTARDQMQVARALEELPRIHAEFAQGRLSFSKVRALIRVADPEMEPELIELAHGATASQLERLLRAYGTATAEDDEAAAFRRHLTTFWEDDGTLTVRGNLPGDEGALLLRALDIAREELFASYVEDASAAEKAEDFTEPPAKPSGADALVALAETTMAKGALAASGGDRHLVVVHVDASVGAKSSPLNGPIGGTAVPPAPGGLDIERASMNDIPLSPEIIKRLACDASIVTLVEADGVPLSVGRKTRTIPPSISRALKSRDGCCVFPGCEQERFVDAHHLTHWADGGETALDNLMLLCRRHHRAVHEGGVTIEGEAGSPVFRRADGRLIEPAPRLPGTKPANPLGPYAVSAPPPWGKGETYDMDLAVFTLAHRRDRRLEQSRKAQNRPPPPAGG